jgi:MscS family membrane protein
MSGIFRGLTLLVIALAACLPVSAPRAMGQILPTQTPASPPKAPADWLNRNTPSGTVFGFLEAAQSGNYATAAQYLQMNPARRQAEGETLAQQLKLVMDRAFAGSLKHVSMQPEGTSEQGIPGEQQILGTMSSGDVEAELILVRVSDPNNGKIWLISSETLAKVPELYDQVEARQVETK